MAPYTIFLLTCWHEKEGDANFGVWRFRLEEPRTGEQHGFGNLEELLLFLDRKLASADFSQRRRE